MINDGVLSGVGTKWKRSDSSDSDCVALMTLLTTPILRFSLIHKGSYGSDSVASENQPLQLRLKYFDSYQVAYMSVFHWNDPTDQAR